MNNDFNVNAGVVIEKNIELAQEIFVENYKKMYHMDDLPFILPNLSNLMGTLINDNYF